MIIVRYEFSLFDCCLVDGVIFSSSLYKTRIFGKKDGTNVVEYNYAEDIPEGFELVGFKTWEGFFTLEGEKTTINRLNGVDEALEITEIDPLRDQVEENERSRINRKNLSIWERFKAMIGW